MSTSARRFRIGTLVVCLLLALRPLAAEIVDRVLAVVSGQIILLSDLEFARAIGLVGRTTGTADPTAAALHELIDRTLILNEVRRVPPPDPPAPEVDTFLTKMRERFDSPAALARTLVAAGLDESQLRGFVADELRIRRYVDERFAGSAQPTNDEVGQYLRDHPEMVPAGMSPTQAADLARQQLAAQREQGLVVSWMAELRRRANITELYKAE